MHMAVTAFVNGAILICRQWTKTVLDNVCSHKPKKGEDIFSFLEDLIYSCDQARLLLFSLLCFPHGRVLVKVYVSSLDHYWLLIVLWLCYNLPIVDQNRFFFIRNATKINRTP